MVLTKNTNVSFTEQGKVFQEKIIQALLTDTKWAAQFSEVVNINFFEKNYLRFLAEKYFDYYTKYKAFPTIGLLISIVKDAFKEEQNDVLLMQITEFLKRIKTNPELGDLEYVKERSLDFCKRQALKEALEKSIEHISNEKYDSVVEEIKQAVSLGQNNTIGLEFFEDLTSRFERANRNVVPTGFVELDHKDILNGGVGNGELNLISGNPGSGKSHYLVQMGANALRLHKNVLHYTLEMSEAKTAIRYDSNLCNIPSQDVYDRKEEVVEFYKNNKLGRLIIKEYPTGAVTALGLRNHIDRLSLKGFKPDLIIIDYADIMRSSRQYEAMRFEVDQIYKDLRNLSSDLQIPIWTASQLNRQSSQSKVIGLDGLSESYGKAMVVDFALSLSRLVDEKYNGTGRLFCMKNRQGRDSMSFAIKIDTSKSKFEILSQSDPNNLDSIDDPSNQSNLKEQLKEKWNKLMKDKVHVGE